jgi:hypothetical protein
MSLAVWVVTQTPGLRSRHQHGDAHQTPKTPLGEFLDQGHGTFLRTEAWLIEASRARPAGCCGAFVGLARGAGGSGVAGADAVVILPLVDLRMRNSISCQAQDDILGDILHGDAIKTEARLVPLTGTAYRRGR